MQTCRYYRRSPCVVFIYMLALWDGRNAHAQTTATLTTDILPLSGGPNVCRSRYRNYCCPGWKIKPGTNLCITPVCWRHCGDGNCIKPNICMCDGGAIGATCSTKIPISRSDDPSVKNQNLCSFFCLNGGTCIDAKCVCKPGFTGNFCAEPVCQNDCLNGGRCIAPDRCACVYGYAGKKCEVDYRIGPCFRKVVNNMCQSQLENVVCTKQLCCTTVGKAWGHPCEQCPLHLDCEAGFLKNIHSGQCVDVDECEAIPDLCDGGSCVNTVGSFQCSCSEGHVRNTITNVCEDENECDSKLGITVCENGQCVNTNGSYYCICDIGYIPTQDRKHCLDSRQSECYLRVDKYKCAEALPMNLSKVDCCCGKNIGKAWGDKCEICPQSGNDDYSVLCLGGISSRNYTSHPLVDECTLRPGICGGGQCTDTLTGFNCDCFPGYEKRKNNGIQVCEDIDECVQGICNGGKCVNSPGSYSCTCPPGFDVSSDGKRCIDQDECLENGMCANGICINMSGSFKCRCNSGYILSPTGHACVDIDECFENPRICLNGRCLNTNGAYQCECHPGFRQTSDEGFCVDIDECASEFNLCENGRCINVEGSFKCVCNSGFHLSADKKTCEDFDECINNACLNGKCINTLGSFRCECPDGFRLESDGRFCLDSTSDLCYEEYRNGQCYKPSQFAVSKSSCCCISADNFRAWGTQCTPCPLFGSVEYKQLCPHGIGITFTGDDINECAQNPFICENGACENLIGTYRCICNNGYAPDNTGKICIDIDECEQDKAVCVGGQCRNTPGNYQCICPVGNRFNASSGVCDDIDECAESVTNLCINGECINSFGSFSCHCSENTKLDNTGLVCLDNRRGSCWTNITGGRCENDLPRLTLKTECCCSVGLGWGSPCELCHTEECDCPKGFAKVDGKMCNDINECELNNELCRGGGTCVNTEGSFTCVCPPGLTLDITGTFCQDTRLDTCYTDYQFGVGISPIVGIFSKTTCCCSAVGKAWGSGDQINKAKYDLCPRSGTAAFNDLCPKGPGFINRKDINECVEFPAICSNGRCKNTIGGFICVCNPGFTHHENGFQCLDIDECSIVGGVCGDIGECHNVPGSFECKCKEGYESHPVMRVCMDIDECEKVPDACIGGNCTNDLGSYHCLCPDGHELAADKRTCKDIDECSRTSGICSNGICENMLGTYQCICDSGYQQADMKSHCEDINECEKENGGCEELCINTDGSFNCGCSVGLSLVSDGRSCVDVDECVESPRICNGGDCVNTLGSYTCTCGFGLLPGDSNSSCIDINECETDPKNICGNGICVNNIGSYTCQCDDGYSIKDEGNLYCSDVDECMLGTHRCDKNSICINNPGSYYCRCLDGFIGDGFSCLDINECLTNNGGCDKNAHCINLEGSFKCTCDGGFKGDGFVCADIDECMEIATVCENGHCINYPGSYRCECEMGFMNPNDTSQQICVDINECQIFDNICIHGRCENMFGMFRCDCNPGYQTDSSGGNCTDINECDSPQACLYGNCTNSEGSFSCTCPPNYQLAASGNACVDVRESRCYITVEEKGGKRRCSQDIGSPVTKATCCCSVGKAWGGRCESCPLNGTEEFQHLCPGGFGYRPNTTTVILEDVNECTEHANLCKNGHCTNTFGSYMCTCNSGFRLDSSNTFCNDIDECAENPDICGVGFCINDEGSFHCICPDGYMGMPNGKECIDTRREECYLNYNENKNVCSQPMSNVQTRMICCCSMGQAWGKPCQPCPLPLTDEYYQLCGNRPGQVKNPVTNLIEEINECALMPQMCNHGTCENIPGSFRCICDPGYVYDDISHQCIDDNECSRTPSPCLGNSQCINNAGSYECECTKGYKTELNKNECVDINECYDQNGICQNGQCVNLDGGFQCLCRNGYSLNDLRDNCIDVDECQRQPNICNNGTCVNFEGFFKCHCHAGFKLSHNNDCIDVDECFMMPHLCRNGRCKNTIGSFLCECADGYILTADGEQCKDLDECVEQDGNCPYPGRCQNTMGSFFCICPSGYRLVQNRTFCEDVNECKETPGICKDGTCVNSDGSFTCQCSEGFTISPSGTYCIDTRHYECYEAYSNGSCSSPRKQQVTMKECCCSMGKAWGPSCQSCPAFNSSEFENLCPMGVGHGDHGEDLNECALMSDICHGGDCINTDGSFRCECPIGFVLDLSGTKCIDDDECSSNPGICGNGTCSNVFGSYECYCHEGFISGSSQTCEDVNECIDSTHHQCAFRCHNTQGSYRCICPYGYTLAEDGKHCQDVDECSTPANKCKYNCKNLIGSFVCTCADGYRKISSSTDDCQDIDECLENRNICENGRCVNLKGTYRCDCFNGFRLSIDGKKCLDERIGYCHRSLVNGFCSHHNNTDQKAVSFADCCCTIGVAWGPQCQFCPSPQTSEYRHLCSKIGFTNDGRHDINECDIIPQLCHNGKCVNTFGSYTCVCNKGYKNDRVGTKCIDINECAFAPSPCQMKCENTDGGYVCGCIRGYTLNRDNSTCRDINECTLGTHVCQQKCVNTNGSYECHCNPGYQRVKDRCLDVDECSQNTVCLPPGTCINTLGSYRCLCPKDYKLDPTGSRCLHAVECPNGNCDKNVFCKENDNKKCNQECPSGFSKQLNNNECIDNNECLEAPCGSGQCINTVGSYQCVCPDGFIFDAEASSCVQMENGCVRSLCAFGCTPLDAGSYMCGCPFGYHYIGQGHCLSTISPIGSSGIVPNLGENIPTFPIDSVSINSDKIIATEGCFSCKVNDAGKRSRHRRTLSNLTAHEVTTVLQENQTDMINTTTKDHSVEENRTEVDIVITSQQIAMRTFILTLQPATKDNFVYRLFGEDSTLFELQNKNNIWTIYPIHELVHNQKVFHFGVVGNPQETHAIHKIFSLYVNLKITH